MNGMMGTVRVSIIPFVSFPRF